jgi:hypothetical protein
MTNVSNLPVAAPAALQFEPRARALVPQTMDECWRLAKICAASGLLPKSFYEDGRDPAAAAFVAIQLGSEVGLSPMTSVQHVAVVNGRPTLFGPAQLAVVQRSGLLETFEEGVEFEAGKPAEAWCRVKRQGRPEKTTRFSWAQASKAGLTTKRGPWQEYPERMMQARARSFALRDAFPDILLGLAYGAEEMADVAPLGPSSAWPMEHARELAPPKAVEAAAPPPGKPAAAASKPPLLIALPDGWPPAEFPRTRTGLREALEFLTGAVVDGAPHVISMNVALLDTIAERMPELAGEVSELRAAAAAALSGPDDDVASDFDEVDEVDEFGLRPLDRPDPEVLPTDPP